MSAKRPATKATDDLIDLAEQALAQRLLKGDVKRLIRARFIQSNPGKTICPRTLESIITAARKRLVELTGRTREDRINDSMLFYESMVRNSGAPVRDRIRAQESIDRLLGLNAPLRHEVTGKDGDPLQVDLAALTDAELSTLEQLATRAQPDPSTPAGRGGDPGGAGPAPAP